jgi:prepilin-type processing-associated H-X9-DG protein
MNRLQNPDLLLRSRFRRGLTILEVVVVLIILVVSAALFLPATRSARGPARKVQCLNNIKNLSVAVSNYQSNNGDRLPFLVNGDGVTGDSWCIQLLPLLDSAALARQLRDHRESVIVNGTPNLTLRPFACPEDEHNFRANGGLSYAANAGYLSDDVWGRPTADLAATLDTLHTPGTLRLGGESFEDRMALHSATGVFWRAIGAVDNSAQSASERPRAPRMTGEAIQKGDGLTYTLLFAENIQSRNWASTNVNDIGFGLLVKSARDGSPQLSAATGRIGASGPLALDPGWKIYDDPKRNPSPNSNILAEPGTAPRPSSQHSGGILNVGYTDGHAANLSEQIDPSILARLITSQGERYGQQPVAPNDIE